MILDGVDWVLRRSQHVQIDQDRLVRVSGELDPDRLRLTDWQVPVVPSWRASRLVDSFLVCPLLQGRLKWPGMLRPLFSDLAAQLP